MGYEHPDDWNKIAAKLNADTAFAAEFKKVYPQGFTGETITNAIAEYEKTLITPNSPFDRYLKGDENAISEEGLPPVPQARLPDVSYRPRHGRPVL